MGWLREKDSEREKERCKKVDNERVSEGERQRKTDRQREWERGLKIWDDWERNTVREKENGQGES